MTKFKNQPYNNKLWDPQYVRVVHNRLSEIAKRPEVKTILEIGSADGSGSTMNIAEGMLKNKSNPKLYCLESDRDRFAALASRFAQRGDVFVVRAKSVPMDRYVSKNILLALSPDGIWNTGQEWEKEHAAYRNDPLPMNGILMAKQMAGVDVFDFVYIDAGWFSADEELNQTYGAKYIALDDVQDIKNARTHQRLCADRCYQEIIREYVCNVFSVFERIQ